MTKTPRPVLTALTLGVGDFSRSVRFYEALGFTRKFRATGDEVAFFDAGGVVLALYDRERIAADASLPPAPAQGFRGVTLAINCRTDPEVDAWMAQALKAGARLVKPAHKTSYGGYCGFFADPDDHVWEAVRAPVFTFTDDGRLILPD